MLLHFSDTCTHAHTHTHTRTYTQTHTHAHTHARTHTRAHTRTHTGAHTHTLYTHAQFAHYLHRNTTIHINGICRYLLYTHLLYLMFYHQLAPPQNIPDVELPQIKAFLHDHIRNLHTANKHANIHMYACVCHQYVYAHILLLCYILCHVCS